MEIGTLNILAAFFAVLAVAFLWFAVYFLRDIIRMAERLEKRGMGSWGIILALPLGLLTPVIISYYLIRPEIPPLEMRLIAFTSLLIASLLIIRPVLALIRISSPMRMPKLLLLSYVLVYAVVNMVTVEPFPLHDGLAECIMVAAELILGASFILLATYTSKFKELTVHISGKRFSTRYELSHMLLIAGLMVPLDATLMKIGIYNSLVEGSFSLELLIRFRFISQVLLTAAGALALVGMLVFKRAVEDFCFRLGSMSALIEGRKK